MKVQSSRGSGASETGIPSTLSRGLAAPARRSVSPLILLVGLAFLMAPEARATYRYHFTRSSGPIFSASFQVLDAAIADGLVTASEIVVPPGFTATIATSAGAFTALTPSSALAVDPNTGTVVYSTNRFTSINAAGALLLTSASFSTSASHGTGVCSVTHVADPPPPLQLASPGLVNGLVRFQVVSASGLSDTFRIEASADLARWAAIATNQTVSGLFAFTDPNPIVSPARYYRAVRMP